MSQKEIYSRVRTGGKEKHAGLAKFVFHRCSQDLRLWIRVKTRAIFSLDICYSRFGPLINCSVFLETNIWVERKKKIII